MIGAISNRNFGVFGALAAAALRPSTTPEDLERRQETAPQRLVFACPDCGARACESGFGIDAAREAAIQTSGFRQVGDKLYCNKHARKRGYRPGKDGGQ